MTLLRSRLLASLVLLGTSVSFATAQAPTTASPMNISRDSHDHTITVDVVVTRKGSKTPVAGLTKQDFGLLDNGQPVSSVSFRELGGTQQPQRAILVVDALNIRITGQEYVRDQVARFLRSREITVPIELAILTDKGVQIQQGFSTDGPGMAAQLERQPMNIRSIPQSSGIYGAGERMDISVNGLLALVSHAAALPGRTLLLWISPGWPILSGPGIDLSRSQQRAIFDRIVRLSTAMREARVTLYAIDPIGAAESVGRSTYYENYLKPLTDPRNAELGDQSLQVLALQSGGLYLNSSAIDLMLEQSLADTEHYYQLSWPAAPTEKPNSFHSITVKTVALGNTVRTRDGYYAQPE